MKECRVCKKLIDPITGFYRNARNRDGYAGLCKKCDSEKGKVYRQRPGVKMKVFTRRAYHRGYKLKSLYGITPEERQLMWDNQDGKCGICTKPMVGPKNCNIDHDHKTGKVRKLLCARCNYYLTALEDRNFLELATNYLKEYL